MNNSQGNKTYTKHFALIRRVWGAKSKGEQLNYVETLRESSFPYSINERLKCNSFWRTRNNHTGKWR